MRPIAIQVEARISYATAEAGRGCRLTVWIGVGGEQQT